jgi:hypothetical protein
MLHFKPPAAGGSSEATDALGDGAPLPLRPCSKPRTHYSFSVKSCAAEAVVTRERFAIALRVFRLKTRTDIAQMSW